LLGAVVCAAVALTLSLVGQHVKRTVGVNVARLDLLRELSKPTSAERLWVWLVILSLIGAFACVIAAVLPLGDAEEPTPPPTIRAPDTTETEAGFTVNLEVAWTNLGESVKMVRTTVESEGQQVFRQRSNKSSDGTVSQEIEFQLPGPATIEVTTEALDDVGKTVGVGGRRVFDVP
jgi:hypothetical protein